MLDVTVQKTSLVVRQVLRQKAVISRMWRTKQRTWTALGENTLTHWRQKLPLWACPSKPYKINQLYISIDCCDTLHRF